MAANHIKNKVNFVPNCVRNATYNPLIASIT